MTGKLWFFAAVPVFVMLTAGCGSNVNKVKAGSWENSSITNEKAFAKAFENGVWADAKNEKGEKVVQFTGKISQGLHDFAVEKLHKSDTRIVFVSACNYLAAIPAECPPASQRERMRKSPVSRVRPQERPWRWEQRCKRRTSGSSGIYRPQLCLQGGNTAR